MEILTIEKEEYQSIIESNFNSDFKQSIYQGEKMAHNGWKTEYVKIELNGKCIGAAMLEIMPLLKVFKYCYIPRGFFIDYKSELVLSEFTNKLKKYLSAKNVIYVEIDPDIDLVQRDINGSVVENGFNNFDVVNNLKEVGWIQLPLKRGYDLSKECRWVSILDLKGKSEDEIFSEFSYQTRQDIRSSEKYCVKTRILKESELSILDDMEHETGQRHHFEIMTLKNYQDLYTYFGKNRIQTLYAYLDLNSYYDKISSEYNRLEKSIENTKMFLEKNPESTKKIKKLKTDKEYFNSLAKKLANIDNLKNRYGNEVPLACALFIKYNHKVVYLVGSSNYEQRVFRGPYAIQWCMIKEAIAEGYDLYDFYGISGYFEKGDEGYGVFDFKRGFNACVHEYIGNFILPVKPLMYKIYKSIKK